MEAHNGEADDLPLPHPLSACDEPLKADETKKWRSHVCSNGFVKNRQQIRLVKNHFKVSLKNTEEFFYHYYYEDDAMVDRKGGGRKVMGKLQQIYATEHANKDSAYDCEKGLFTISALPQVNNEFFVVGEDFSTGKTLVDGSPWNDSLGSDRKRIRRPYDTKRYKVGLSFAAKIPMSAITHSSRGQESKHSQEAIQVINIILRQHSAKHVMGCRGNGDSEEVSAYHCFVKNHSIELRYSGGYPCINVGKPKQLTHFPIELYTIVPLQRYTKALSTLQRSSFVEKSRQKPLERMSVISHVLRCSNYNSQLMPMACGISISKSFTDADGRVLQAPKLRVVNGEHIFTCNGTWNFNYKVLITDKDLVKWTVNISFACCNVWNLVQDLVDCGGIKDIKVEQTFAVFDENPSVRQASAVQRVEETFEQVKAKIPGEPKFILCVLNGRKDSDVYGPWKKKCHAKFGIFTQCLSPTRVSGQYLTNNLLKINAKLVGLNSMLQMESVPVIPFASHGSPGQSDVPSLAAVMLAYPDPEVLAKATKAKRSVFTVIVAKRRDYSTSPIIMSGSAFVIKQTRNKCFLLTCEHVIRGEHEFFEDRDMIFVRRMCDGRGMRVQELRGHLVYFEERTDLAMIRVDGMIARVPVLTLDFKAEVSIWKERCCRTPVHVGGTVFTRAPAVSPGMIRSLHEKKGAGGGTEKLLFNLSCIGMPGMSGCPVMCSNSNDVVAVVLGGLLDITSDGFPITLAICSETVHGVIREWLNLPPDITCSIEELIDML